MKKIYAGGIFSLSSATCCPTPSLATPQTPNQTKRITDVDLD